MNVRLLERNEFDIWFKWFDYLSITVLEVPLVLVRKYEWYDTDRYTFVIKLFGYEVFKKKGGII